MSRALLASIAACALVSACGGDVVVGRPPTPAGPHVPVAPFDGCACPERFFCRDGACVSRGAVGAPCASDDTCDDGRCRDGTCRALDACSDDATCAEGLVCASEDAGCDDVVRTCRAPAQNGELCFRATADHCTFVERPCAAGLACYAGCAATGGGATSLCCAP